jgi:heme exporter protein CcmD
MSNHLVFIVLSYTAGLLILGWTAFSPLLKKRTLLSQLQQVHRDTTE